MSESETLVDGVRAGAKRLGRKKERAADSPLPPQPRTCVYEHQRLNMALTSHVITGMFNSTCRRPNHTSYPHSRPTSSYSRGTS